jgi:transposase
MAQQRKQYDSVFKQKAVELADARGNVREVAAELGISPDLIYRWKCEAKIYGSGGFSGKGRPKMTAHEPELVDLRKKLRDAEMERDILKKAITIFSSSDRKGSRSVTHR